MYGRREGRLKRERGRGRGNDEKRIKMVRERRERVRRVLGRGEG